jgi:glycosyltransferase involved in cell wall biosynthesis
MKILMVSRWFPWPANTGSRIRTLGVLSALVELGDVDLFVLNSRDRQPVVPPDARLVRLGVGPSTDPGYQGIRRVEWAVRGRVPFELFSRDYSGLRRAFQEWAGSDYDAIWVNRAESYVALAPCLQGPVVVDLDDLQDRKLLAQLSIPRTFVTSSLRRRLWLPYRAQKNARLWRSLQLRVAREVEAVTVTSELDRSRFGVSNTAVIPNGYELPGPPVGKRSPGQPPTIMFQGFLSYGPNVDAAQFLAKEVLPELRSRLGEVRIRLVGLPNQRVAELRAIPEVTVTGPVENMTQELSGADVVLVPLRFGSGTRIKILEAFANRIPVVSTRLGAEGLEVEDGRHLLIADSAQALAAACVEVLTDHARRADVVDEAERLFHERYRWDRIHEGIRTLVQKVAAKGVLARRSR